MEIKIVSDPEALAEYIPDWELLSAAALEPNPFYEHWMLLPALRHFRRGKDVQCLLILQKDGPSLPKLCALFPLERIRPYMGLPVCAWSLWKYNHCPLAMPLIRKDCVREALAVFFDWLSSLEAGAHLLEWRYVPGEGNFHQILTDALREKAAIPLVWERFTRAFFRPMESADHYFGTTLSSKHRKALRRRAEQLAELGPVEFTVLDNNADIEEAITCFLQIESSGWKGREGSAMACQESNRNFFREAVSGAFQQQHLLMTSLKVGGKSIAQNCYFRTGKGSFHFKPSFDEEYSQFSPGFHMECELIRHLHAHPEIEWMDSCTSTDNEMYNRLFLARRTIETLLIPVRGGVGGLLVSAIPCLRYLKHAVRSVLNSPSRNGNSKTETVETVK
jgi:hypothetical protein